ncbi:Vacuolar protein-sorting-associated protein 27 [Terramyces sp. JEL0728]|nr:Vacuolar protein-sorting-associated protein 27 [Terramyces sp. JEL0728]
MNLFANPADEDIEKATSENLPIGTEDLATNLDIADKIKSGKISPKNYVAAIKKRINHKNPNVTLLALKLTDTCVKNSGKLLLQENTHEQVRKKSLELIQTWAAAFKGRSEFFTNTGMQFPPIEKANSLAVLFETTTAPEWTDSDYCMRCRTDFTTFNRKHHCRNCGSTFCQDCSSKSIPLPLLGITDPVRVCDTCHYKITTKTGDVGSTPVKLNKPARVDSDDDEDLAKAIAESLELAKKSTSLPRPREEKPKAKSKEDEELELAIQESLKEADRQGRLQSTPKHETRYEQTKTEAKVGGLAESQVESIRIFCDLVEKADRDVQQGGLGNLNPIPLQTTFAKVSSLHRPLVDSLSEAADKYKALYDLNTELTNVIKDYDVLLQQRLQYSQSVSGGLGSNPQYGYPSYGTYQGHSFNPGPPYAPGHQSNPSQSYGQQYPVQGGYSPAQYPPQSQGGHPVHHAPPAQYATSQTSNTSTPQYAPFQPPANQPYTPSHPPNTAQYEQSTAPSQPGANDQYSAPPGNQYVPSQPPASEYAGNQEYAPSQPQQYPQQFNSQPNQYGQQSQQYNPNGPHHQAYPPQPGYPNQTQQQQNPPAKPQEAPASDWDVNSFLWTGRLRMISVGDDVALHLEDNTTGELFAKCPITDGAVEPVLDSSRYFVIKVVAPTGQYAFVGLGFQERSYAFDMNVALQDHQKRVNNKGAIQEQPKFESIDYSLKEGQKIEISLNGFNKEKKDKVGDFSKFVIAPPPSNQKWDDFGDFKSDTDGWTSFE